MFLPFQWPKGSRLLDEVEMSSRWHRLNIIMIRFNICILSKIKETKIILRNIYYSQQSKNSISLKVGEKTNFLSDSEFGNSLCTRALEDTSQNQKRPSFFLASHAPWNWATPPGVIPRGPKHAQKPWKGSELPQLVKFGQLFRANLVILLLQISSLTLNYILYILSDMWKAQVKEKIKILVW